MAFCKKCGKEMEEGAKFCQFCGDESVTNNDSVNNFDSMVNELNNTKDFTNEFDKNDIENNKVMGILSYLGILVLVPILAAKDSKFAKFHANQGLMVVISYIILMMVSGALGALPLIGFIGVILSMVSSAGILILEILGIVNVVNGRAKEIPILGKYRLLK